MNILFLLLCLGLVLWFWQNGLRAWEQARTVSARACQRLGVQLLDDTVALERLWLRRDRQGRLRWERIYTFEFTDAGVNRRIGRVIMIGREVEVLAMEDSDLFVP
jgi:hypothetical protein